MVLRTDTIQSRAVSYFNNSLLLQLVEMESDSPSAFVPSNGGIGDTPDILGFKLNHSWKEGLAGLSSGSKPAETAKMVVGRDALFYNMNHKNRGIALIFNHENFDQKTLNRRNGTNADCDALESCFKHLGFDVIIHKDLTCGNVIKEAEKVITNNSAVAALDHSENDCFIMCVLSHGEENIIFACDFPYQHEDIWGPFTADKCKTLAGKPKMFFIQACQGKRLDPGVTVTQFDSSQSYKIPIHADFLIAYSTIPGFFSWRNTGKGSWFIQAFIAEMKESVYHYDLLTILTFVNRRVAIDFESNVPDNPLMHSQKQIPCITSMLTRLIKFSPKNV